MNNGSKISMAGKPKVLPSSGAMFSDGSRKTMISQVKNNSKSLTMQFIVLKIEGMYWNVFK